MIEYEVKIRPELIGHSGFGPATAWIEVQQWLSDNKVFGWRTSSVPTKQEYYIHFTNTTDAMLFTLRWS